MVDNVTSDGKTYTQSTKIVSRIKAAIQILLGMSKLAPYDRMETFVGYNYRFL